MDWWSQITGSRDNIKYDPFRAEDVPVCADVAVDAVEARVASLTANDPRGEKTVEKVIRAVLAAPLSAIEGREEAAMEVAAANIVRLHAMVKLPRRGVDVSSNDSASGERNTQTCR
jgi:hypothetical protein